LEVWWLTQLRVWRRWPQQPEGELTTPGAAGAAPGEAERAAQQAAAELAGLAALRGAGCGDAVLRTMRALDPEKLNYDLGAAALRWIAGQAAAGAVLVFLPGAHGLLHDQQRALICMMA